MRVLASGFFLWRVENLIRCLLVCALQSVIVQYSSPVRMTSFDVVFNLSSSLIFLLV